MPTSASLNPLPSASLEKKQHLEWLSLFLLLTVLAAALGYFLYLDRQQIEDAEKQRLDAQTRVIEASITRQLEAVNRALIAIRTDIPNQVWVGGRTLYNMMANYELKSSKDIKWSFFARVDNLFDRFYYSTIRGGSDGNGDGVYNAEDMSITVNPGREWTVGLSAQF